MRVAVYSHRAYEAETLDDALGRAGIEPVRLEARLDVRTAALAVGTDAVCAFVNDDLSAPVLEALVTGGVRGIALRCAGFNNVDIDAARRLGLRVLRVPAYSPAAVAEHALGLMLTLNRKTHRAYQRVREGNLALDGLVGFDFEGKTVAVVGAGRIGTVMARILAGLGCRVLAVDPQPEPVLRARVEALGGVFVPLDEALPQADIVTLHCPLAAATKHLVDACRLAAMKPGAMLINTSRGGLVDTKALIAALKRRHLGSVGLDVYEEEAGLFDRDLSERGIDDDVFARLLTFPNVVVTAHQGFLTREALTQIAATTAMNLLAIDHGQPVVERELG
ncbi:2-hydroxyacid dehydrogenase [Silanimonas algicola]